LNDSFAVINEFLKENPGEIFILDIPVDSDAVGTVGNPTPHYIIDQQIR